jgi:hypothetical protein
LLAFHTALLYVRPVFASGQAEPSVLHALRVPAEGRAATQPRQRNARVGASRPGVLRLSAPAWGAICVTATFIALSCWWLIKDHSIPIYDVGDQLETALEYHKMLVAGNLLGPLDHVGVYPILVHIVGAVAMLIGGINVASPTIGEDVVFVPLLALGCYRTGRLLFGPLAGMLAVTFVFGSPLLMSLFHVFLLDAPLTALVAVSVWLVLESKDFERVGVSAAAGLAVGAGMNIKVQFGLFLAALVIVVLAHGGWRNWRGFALFCLVALAIGCPWYAVHASELPRMFSLASSGPGTPAGNIPPTLSVDNFTWYFWNVLNSQLLAPLFIFLLVGIGWSLRMVIRARAGNAARLEFLVGGFGAWLAITLTPHHDIRYGLPLLGFLAVVATGWIVYLPRGWRLAISAILALIVVANTLGMTIGVGREAKVALSHPLSSSEQKPGRVIIYATNGFLASAPSSDGDVPGLLRRLREDGVQTVSWSIQQSEAPDFSLEGLIPLARMAGLASALGEGVELSSSSTVATLIHEPAHARGAPPCARLADGTAVWVARFDAAAHRMALYCPTPRPRFYDLGVAG